MPILWYLVLKTAKVISDELLAKEYVDEGAGDECRPEGHGFTPLYFGDDSLCDAHKTACYKSLPAK